MKYICIVLIRFYQIFISPYKGFRCAHHALYQQESCSNKVKDLIAQRGFFGALPLVRIRFTECRKAYEHLQLVQGTFPRADIPCDLPCDVSFGSCSIGESAAGAATNHWGFCALPCWFDLSKKARRNIAITSVVSTLVLSYVFYGRDISQVYVTDLGEQNQNIIKRLVQRESPQVRILLVSKGKKFYSEIINVDQVGEEYKFRLDKPLSSFEIDSLKVLDARVNIANKIVVVGQILEEFENPAKKSKGERFSYRIKRRWHF